MKILGIETSCDETAAAIIENKKNRIKILSSIVSSQISLHKKYGGVYPELAARSHLENILFVVETALAKAKTNLKEINTIAVTTGPGLIGSLLVGVNTAKTLSYTLNKPIVSINHLEAHIYSCFATESQIIFPVLVLIVSGGHTLLVLMKNHGNYYMVGQTRDDAAGEAFDKVATLLGLPYPGGPSIEKEAQKAGLKNKKTKIQLPRPMMESKNFDFSFSGLKTAVLYLVKQFPDEQLKNIRQEIALEFQHAVVETLVEKTLRAARQYKVKKILVCGGVASNSFLRREFKSKTNFLIPPKDLCTDNAVMVAVAGYFKTWKKGYDKWYNVSANANLKLKNW